MTRSSVELAPLATVLGLALMVTVAVGFGLTVTVVDWVALPPAPLQFRNRWLGRERAGGLRAAHRSCCPTNRPRRCTTWRSLRTRSGLHCCR